MRASRGKEEEDGGSGMIYFVWNGKGRGERDTHIDALVFGGLHGAGLDGLWLACGSTQQKWCGERERERENVCTGERHPRTDVPFFFHVNECEL